MRQDPPTGARDDPPSGDPPRRAGRPALTQHWRDVAFVHWDIDPAQAAPLLPAGTRPDVPDVLEGRTYVGLVAFRVAAPRAFGLVPTGSFNEANVRLYAVDRHGRRGVVFLTMDADALPSVLAARALAGVPYIWSDVSLRTRGSTAAGAVRRRVPGPPASGRWRIAVREPIPQPGPLERFLTDRYGLHTAHLGRTRWLPVAHPPWPLFRADLLHYEGDLLAAAGIDIGDRPPASVLWSPGTTAAFHLPHRPKP